MSVIFACYATGLDAVQRLEQKKVKDVRNNVATVQLLVGWRANVNLQARGNDLPLVFAVKQQRPEMVRCLLDL